MPKEVRRTGAVVLLTGLSGAGKSTITRALVDRLARRCTVLDGDEMRQILTPDLGYSPEDRAANVRRVGWVAAQIAHHGGLALCALIAPSAPVRDEVRHLVTDAGGTFVLVYVATPLDQCEARDVKGFYARARTGEMTSFTGVSHGYDVPTNAEIVLPTDDSIAATVDRLVAELTRLDVLEPSDLR